MQAILHCNEWTRLFGPVPLWIQSMSAWLSTTCIKLPNFSKHCSSETPSPSDGAHFIRELKAFIVNLHHPYQPEVARKSTTPTQPCAL